MTQKETCAFVEFTPTHILINWRWCRCVDVHQNRCVWECEPSVSIYVRKHTHYTRTHTVHYSQPCLKRAQGGFVGLWKGPRKMFSDKLFTIPQSLLGRVLHRAVWRITPSPSLSLSLSLFLSLSLSLSLSLCLALLFPSITHSLFQCALSVCVSVLSLSPFSLSHFFVFCDTGPHAPREGPSSRPSCRW